MLVGLQSHWMHQVHHPTNNTPMKNNICVTNWYQACLTGHCALDDVICPIIHTPYLFIYLFIFIFIFFEKFGWKKLVFERGGLWRGRHNSNPLVPIKVFV